MGTKMLQRMLDPHTMSSAISYDDVVALYAMHVSNILLRA